MTTPAPSTLNIRAAGEEFSGTFRLLIFSLVVLPISRPSRAGSILNYPDLSRKDAIWILTGEIALVLGAIGLAVDAFRKCHEPTEEEIQQEFRVRVQSDIAALQSQVYHHGPRPLSPLQRDTLINGLSEFPGQKVEIHCLPADTEGMPHLNLRSPSEPPNGTSGTKSRSPRMLARFNNVIVAISPHDAKANVPIPSCRALVRLLGDLKLADNSVTTLVLDTIAKGEFRLVIGPKPPPSIKN
jgi:hypothetical protein